MVSLSLLGRLVTDPKATSEFLVGGKEGLHRYVTARLLAVQGGEIRSFYAALEANAPFLKSIKSGTEEVGIYLGEIARPSDLYVMCRTLRPKVVVETGVANGISTAFMLQALADNSLGRLYSIDSPVFNMLPPGKEIGWIIPLGLRDRWELLVGRSVEVLPDLLNRVESVDMFIHDADARDMAFEFESIWAKMNQGGLILSDHVDMRVSDGEFYKFARSVRRTPAHLYSRLGAIRK